MKLSLSIVALFSCFFSFAQYEGLIVEEVDNGPDVPGKTYRIYAQVASDSSQVVIVFGDKKTPLEITTTTSFYQHENGGPSSASINRKESLESTTLRYDSYVTIGFEDNYFNQTNVSLINLTEFEAGGRIFTDDGAWFAMPYQEQCYPNEDGRVLLMQLTTTGVVEGLINLQVRHLTGQGDNAAGNPDFENNNIRQLTFTCGG